MSKKTTIELEQEAQYSLKTLIQRYQENETVYQTQIKDLELKVKKLESSLINAKEIILLYQEKFGDAEPPTSHYSLASPSNNSQEKPSPREERQTSRNSSPSTVFSKKKAQSVINIDSEEGDDEDLLDFEKKYVTSPNSKKEALKTKKRKVIPEVENTEDEQHSLTGLNPDWGWNSKKKLPKPDITPQSKSNSKLNSTSTTNSKPTTHSKLNTNSKPSTNSKPKTKKSTKLNTNGSPPDYPDLRFSPPKALNQHDFLDNLSQVDEEFILSGNPINKKDRFNDKNNRFDQTGGFNNQTGGLNDKTGSFNDKTGGFNDKISGFNDKTSGFNNNTSALNDNHNLGEMEYSLVDLGEYDERQDERNPLKFQQTVRRKSDREDLPASICKVCAQWYEAMGQDFSVEDLIQKCSRHRSRVEAPDTPTDYWRLSFPESSESSPVPHFSAREKPIFQPDLVFDTPPRLNVTNQDEISTQEPVTPAKATRDVTPNQDDIQTQAPFSPKYFD